MAPFLVFEGLDGSGKSTLMRLICEELSRRQIKFIQSREPGGTPLAEEIRHLLLRVGDEVPVPQTELLLYSASRAQHVARVIRPALESETWVLCDRFSASTVSFQCFARNLSRPNIDWLNRFAQDGVNPSLTILLDLTVEESQKRQSQRHNGESQAADRMEREAYEFHQKVREGYLAQAKESPQSWLVLDACDSPENLCSAVLTVLRERKWL